MAELNAKQTKAIKLVIAYPFGILAISLLTNMLFFEIGPFRASMPTSDHLWAVAIAGICLVINHSLLMTTTELVRVKYKLYATPEEWKASGTSRQDAPVKGLRELERNHNAHRNSTENTCYFLVLIIPFLLVSPPVVMSYLWIAGFAVARLGHTFSYLTGKDNLRGIFMSFSLLAMYGIVCYLAFSGLGFLLS